jgi:hypothetical protein
MNSSSRQPTREVMVGRVVPEVEEAIARRACHSVTTTFHHHCVKNSAWEAEGDRDPRPLGNRCESRF